MDLDTKWEKIKSLSIQRIAAAAHSSTVNDNYSNHVTPPDYAYCLCQQGWALFSKCSAAGFALQRSASDFEIPSAVRFSAAGVLALQRFAAVLQSVQC
jgi:hypothetical protein